MAADSADQKWRLTVPTKQAAGSAKNGREPLQNVFFKKKMRTTCEIILRQVLGKKEHF